MNAALSLRVPGATASASGQSSLARLAFELVERADAYRRYRRTVRLLSRLSDHELSDIGVKRGEIERIARGA